MIDLYRDWYWSNLLSSWESSVELCVYLSTFNNITEKCHTRNQMLVRKSWKYCIHIRCMIVTNWQRSVRGKFSTEGINLILIDSNHYIMISDYSADDPSLRVYFVPFFYIFGHLSEDRNWATLFTANNAIRDEQRRRVWKWILNVYI